MINVLFYQFSKTLAEVLGSSCKSRRVYSDLRSHRGVTFLNQGQARPQENYNHNIFTPHYVYYTRLQIQAHSVPPPEVFLCLPSIISKGLPKTLQSK